MEIGKGEQRAGDIKAGKEKKLKEERHINTEREAERF